MNVYVLVGLFVIADLVLIGWLVLKDRKRQAAKRNRFEAARKKELDAQIERVLYPRTKGPHGFAHRAPVSTFQKRMN